jgi:hypothetical protein
MQTIESGLGTNSTAATISEAELGERTCPDTPNRKYPDIVPKGNIPTKLPNRKYPDTKKAVGIFPVGQQEIFRHNFGQQEMFRQHIICRNISYCPTGNIPTDVIAGRYCRAALLQLLGGIIAGRYCGTLLHCISSACVATRLHPSRKCLEKFKIIYTRELEEL